MHLRRLAPVPVALAAAACSDAVEFRVPVSVAAYPDLITIPVGASAPAGATVTGGTGAARLEWRSLAPGIAAADPVKVTDILVRGVGPGTTSIVVSLVGQPAVADTVMVVISPAPCPLLGPVVSPAQAQVAVGDTVRLRVSMQLCPPLPAGADTSAFWTSLQPEVANVDSFGLVSGLAPGVATIRVAAWAAPNIVATATVTIR
jgi:hypothetical protein